MKNKNFLLLIAALLMLCSCEKDKFTVRIDSPKDGAELYYYRDIYVSVTAKAEKGSINQVVLTVDTFIYKTLEPPYLDTIPASTFPKNGFYPISVVAYGANGGMEGTSIEIKIIGY